MEEGDRLEGDRHTRRQADPPTPPQDLLIHRDRPPPLRLPGSDRCCSVNIIVAKGWREFCHIPIFIKTQPSQSQS